MHFWVWMHLPSSSALIKGTQASMGFCVKNQRQCCVPLIKESVLPSCLLTSLQTQARLLVYTAVTASYTTVWANYNASSNKNSSRHHQDREKLYSGGIYGELGKPKTNIQYSENQMLTRLTTALDCSIALCLLFCHSSLLLTALTKYCFLTVGMTLI